MRREQVASPAAKLNHKRSWGDFSCHIGRIRFQDPDFVVCEIVFIEVGDLSAVSHAYSFTLTSISNDEEPDRPWCSG